MRRLEVAAETRMHSVQRSASTVAVAIAIAELALPAEWGRGTGDDSILDSRICLSLATPRPLAVLAIRIIAA